MSDLISNPQHTPSLGEITDFIGAPGNVLWRDLQAFLQETQKARFRIQYSQCPGKKGWNVKYHRAGQSLCTLYPEEASFVALVVIAPDLASRIEAEPNRFHTMILGMLANTKPYLGGLWLMIPVTEKEICASVKKLIELKIMSKSRGKGV